MKAGETFGHYRIVRRLGAGGMAEVYEAIDERLDRRVALKFLSDPDRAVDPNAVERFEREARAVAALEHEGIVPIYDIGSVDRHWYIAMRLLKGGDLTSHFQNQPASPEDALRVTQQIALALAYMHQRGVIHRDIKPANILFDQNGSPVVADFGIAKIQEATNLTQVGATIGTVRYMSPEQALGKELTGKADIYSLGVVLYELLTGAVPFTGDSVAVLYQHCSEAPPPLAVELQRYQPLIDALLAKSPEERPDAETLAALIGGYLQAPQAKTAALTEALSAYQRRVEAPVRKPIKIQRALVLGVPLVCLVAVLVVVRPWVDTVAVAEAEASTPSPVVSTMSGSESNWRQGWSEGVEKVGARIQQGWSQIASTTAGLWKRKSQLEFLAEQFDQHLANGRVSKPDGNNAAETLQVMRGMDPEAPQTRAAQEDLGQRYLSLFTAAMENGQMEQAGEFLERTSQTAPGLPGLAAAQAAFAQYRVAAQERERQQRVAREMAVEAERRRREAEMAKLQADRLAAIQARAEAKAEAERREKAEQAAREADLKRTIAAAEAQRRAQVVAVTENQDQKALQREQAEAEAQAQEAARRQREEQLRLEREQQRRLEEERRLASSVDGHLVGEPFQDCPQCPEMVVIPQGNFRMGSASRGESPTHTVTLKYPLAVGRFEVTFDQWAACLDEKGCDRHKPDDEDWGRGNRPVIDVSWKDIQYYLKWLSQKTGANYRLLTEAEWEYAARAGSEGEYGARSCPDAQAANFEDVVAVPGCTPSGRFFRQTRPVGSYAPNAFGIYDMQGNVFEWTQDCWAADYAGAPVDGSALESGGNCDLRALRGGSWWHGPRSTRVSHRQPGKIKRRYDTVGFRVARTN